MSKLFQSISGRWEPLLWLFVLSILGEAAYKILWWLGWGDLHLSQYVKGLVQIVLLVLVIRKEPKALFPVLILLVMFSLGQIGMVSRSQYFENLVFFDRYFYTLLPLIGLVVLGSSENLARNLERVFFWYVGLNSLAIIVGWATGLPLFETYPGSRFGYSGFMLRSGGATYLYWIALYYLITAMFSGRRRLWGLLLLVLMASFLLGTKTMFIGYGLLLVYVLLLSGLLDKWISWAVIAAFVLAGMLAFEPIMAYLMGMSGTFSAIVEQDGLSAAIWSYRDVLLIEDTLPRVARDWNWWNYLFGGAEDMHYRSQFGLFDLLFFFGLFGTVLLLALYKKYLFGGLWTKQKLFFLCGTGVLVCLSGNFLYETSLAFLLVVLRASWNSSLHSSVPLDISEG